MIYFKAVGGRSVNMNVKPAQRSPSVSVVCECVSFLINIMQVRRINTGAGVDIHGANNVSVI